MFNRLSVIVQAAGFFAFIGIKIFLKMMDIDTKLLCCLDEVEARFGIDCSWEWSTPQLGFDGKIYTVYYTNEGGEDLEEGSKDIRCLCITPDWSNGKMISAECLDLGCHELMYPIALPIGGNILLLGLRCRKYKDGSFDNNAVIVSKSGEIIRSFCAGDGIQDCIATSGGRIITSYFDEGVFGNYGWNGDQIGRAGLICWNEYGEKLWQNYSLQIFDCCATNIDDEGSSLWFYYYGYYKSQLVNCLACRSESGECTVYDLASENIHFIMISKSGDTLIMNGHGYNCDEFRLVKILTDGKFKEDLARFVHNGEVVKNSINGCLMSSGSRAVLLPNVTREKGSLYIAELNI